MATFPIAIDRPSKNDPYIYLYNNKEKGGLSWCINGKPKDPICNVLANCVGWACGRFNHIYNLITGYKGIKYPKFCCNAENFIEVAKAYGLKVGQTPKPGAIMCWQKGPTLNSSDGAGHVAIVERVDSPTRVYTSESGYNYKSFYNKTRDKGDGNWGSSSAYKFRGFIYNPAMEEDDGSTDDKYKLPTPVSRKTTVDQLQVIVTSLRVRIKPSTKGYCIGFAKKGYYNYTEVTNADGYTWYCIADDCWVAYDPSWIKLYPAKKEAPKTDSSELKIGDLVTMEKNAPIYGKKTKFASWVYKSDLYVRAISGNKITVSIYKTGSITGTVDKKYLTKK